jgi:Predicted permease
LGNKHGFDKDDIKKGLILAGSLCIVVVFYILIGKIGALFAAFGKLFKAMSSIIIGCIIAFLLNPLMNLIQKGVKKIYKKLFKKWNEKKLYKVSKITSVTITMLSFVALIVCLMLILIPELRDSVVKFTENFGTYTNNVQNWANKLLHNYPQLEQVVNTNLDNFEVMLTDLINKKLIPNMDTIVIYVSSGIMSGVKIITDIIIGMIVAVYLLLSKDVLMAQGKKLIYAVFDKKRGNVVLHGFSYVNSVFGGFLNGKIVDSVIIGLICSIVLNILDMPYSTLISVIIGVTNIIPFFGPIIGAIPSGVLVLVDNPKKFLVFLIFVIILQQFDGNVLGPLILGDSTGLSGLWVLFAILVGGNLFGFPGMILGVPVFACFYTLATILLRNGLNKRGLNNSTEYFMEMHGFTEDGRPISSDEMVRETAKERRQRINKFNQLQHAAGEKILKVTENVIHHKPKDDDGNESSDTKKDDDADIK